MTKCREIIRLTFHSRSSMVLCLQRLFPNFETVKKRTETVRPFQVGPVDKLTFSVFISACFLEMP